MSAQNTLISYTPTPWSIGLATHENGEFIETAIMALDGRAAVAVCLDFGFNNPTWRDGNAARIVACVNACSSINDPETTVPALLSRIAELEAQLAAYPADWRTDSSLKTWFPLTAKLLKQQHHIADSRKKVQQEMAAEYQQWIDFYHAGNGDYSDFLAIKLKRINENA